jgi:death-on-curing protein
MTALSEPKWLGRLVIDAIHHDMITTHGGLSGVRDERLLESALARPRQVFTYGAGIDIAALGAAYACGLARNHPYHDGNKRVAFMAMAVFSEMNGYELVAEETEIVEAMLGLADGMLEEESLAEWLRGRLIEAHDSSV